MMNSLRHVFDNLPESEKDVIFEHLKKALLWRGWTRLRFGDVSQSHEIEQIAEVFLRNGTEIPEYT